MRVLIAAGPTREPIDPIRFISNHSSGKMGYALAKAAVARGYRVTLISGPVSLPPPPQVKLYTVETSKDMHTVVLREAKRADIVIMAAAVADYRPSKISLHKIKKDKNTMILKLTKTPDILKELGQRKLDDQILVGFAAETNRLLFHAKQKLKSKNLDFIFANLVGKKGVGFESDDNQITLIHRDGYTHRFPRMNKIRLAQQMIGLITRKNSR